MEENRIEVFHNRHISVYDVFICNNRSHVCLIGYYGRIDNTDNLLCIFNSKYTSGATLIDDNGPSDEDSKVLIILFPIPNEIKDQDHLNITIKNSLTGEIIITTDLSYQKIVKKNYFSVATLFKDEQRCIEEWIDYYLTLGANHFYLYDNNSKNRAEIKEKLSPYWKKGLITYITWDYPYTCCSLDNSWRFTQRAQMNHCLYRYRDENDWILFSDIDEYVYPVNKKTKKILTYLEKYHKDTKVSALVLKSIWFGNSGYNMIPDGPVIKNFIWRDKESAVNGREKCIVKPELVINMHIHRVKKSATGAKPIEISPNEIRLNHYWAVSDNKRRFKDLHNEVKDTGMHKYLPKEGGFIHKINKFIKALLYK